MKRLLPILIVAGLALAGCSGMMPWGGVEMGTNLAALAATVVEYYEESIVENLGNVDKDDYEEAGSGAKAIYMTDETEKTLANGTVVTITKTLDDSGTPDDTTDDILTVYRQYEIWSGETKTEIIVRPLRPLPEWSGWDENGRLIQEGTVTIQIDGFTVHQGSATATWRLDINEVWLEKLETEITSVSGSGTIVKSVKEWDENGLITVTQTRVRVTPDGLVETREYSIEEVIIDGEGYAKILADDGSYAIIINKVDPRVVEHYDAEGTLRMITTVTRDPDTRERIVERRLFDENGEETGEVITVSLRYRVLGDTVLVTRTRDGRETTVSIRETAEGYEVIRQNITYSVVFSGTDVLIYGSNGDLIATVSRDEVVTA